MISLIKLLISIILVGDITNCELNVNSACHTPQDEARGSVVH